MTHPRRRRSVPRRTETRKEREAQRRLKIACDHFFGPEGDLSPAQIARLRGSQEPERSLDPYWGGIGA
jgi:hypothetical protein